MEGQPQGPSPLPDGHPFLLSAAEFDKKYKSAFSKLAGSIGKESLKQRRAQPPTSKAIDCRKSFGTNLEC